MGDPRNRAKLIFLEAIEDHVPEQWPAFVEQACAGDVVLRAEVEKLLRAQSEMGSFHEMLRLPQLVPDHATASESPGTVIGPYKLLEQIGEGGFGVVFMAEQQRPVRRKVALKVIKPGMDTKQVVARFEAERQALALMDHPHIAHVLDAGGTDSGRPYFVMELIRGIPITQFCDENQLTPRERLELFRIVCQAVQHAHQKGIIHRDLKPSNVLVTLLDGTPVVKVIDFGIAKALGQERLTDKTLFTGFAHMIGTPLYMSPEQAEMSGEDADTRTDIYSLGVLLYELLTGTTPFNKERLKQVSYDEIRRIIREEQPAKPSTRISTLGQAATTVSANRKSEPKRLSQLFRRELDWIVMKALEKDRDRRYDAASSFAADVQRYLDDEPVQACSPSLGYRFSKFIRKYRLRVVIAAAFALLVVAGILASAWQAVRATRAEATASRQAYAASIRLMQPAWESHNMSELYRLLAETATFPERGFEWNYWQRMCHVEHLTLVGHIGGLTAVAFAPDGQRLATGGKDGTARIWEATNGQELLCLRDHRCEVTSVAFAAQGQRLVTGSTDGTAKLWDISKGHVVYTVQAQDTGPVWAVAVTPGGQRLVTGNEDATAWIWDIHRGRHLLTLKGHTRPVSTVAATPDRKRIVTAGLDDRVIIWDALSGLQLRSFIGNLGPDAGINGVAVGPNGKRLMTAGNDNNARIWDADTGWELVALSRSTGWVLSIAATPDEHRFITGHGSDAAKLWETAALPDIAASTLGLLCSPLAPGPLLAASLYPRRTQMMRGREILTLMGHKDAVTSVAASPDGKRLATASLDGTARVWDLTSGRGNPTLRGHTDAVWSVAVTADGQKIVSTSLDGTSKIWDVTSGRQLMTLQGHTGHVGPLAVTPDGRRIITASTDQTVRIWDGDSGGRYLTLDDDTTRGIRSIAVTPDGNRFVTGATDGTIRLRDITSGREFRPPLKGPRTIATSVAVTQDGQRIFVGSLDGTARLWEISNGRILLELREPAGEVVSVAITPDSQQLITGCNDGTATVWDGANGRELFYLKGHTDWITSIAVAPNGKRIVTGSVDGTARLWDAVSGRELLTLDGHTGPVRSVTFAPDGQRLISGNQDGTVHIWEAASPEENAAWVRQDQKVERQRVAWQRPGRKAQGFIQDWLVLGPLALKDDQTDVEALERLQLREANLRPQVGDRESVGGQEFTWQKHQWDEPVLDFNQLSAKLAKNRVAYAVCYVTSAAERNDLLLQMGSNHHAKVYLNGQEVYTLTRGSDFPTLDPVGPVRLRKGANILVLRMRSFGPRWQGCARFVDREGNSVPELKVRLAPE